MANIQLEHILLPAELTGGKRSFLASLFDHVTTVVSKRAEESRDSRPPDAPAGESGPLATSATDLQSARVQLLSKPIKETVKVDLGQKLEEHGLAKFPVELWPQINAVRELAGKLQKREKAGEANVFLSVELKKCVVSCSCSLRLVSVQRFLLDFCPGMVRVSLDLETHQWYDPKEARRLDLCMWLTAWDAYSLAGVALDQASLWFSGSLFFGSLLVSSVRL